MPFPTARAVWVVLLFALGGCAPEPEVRTYLVPRDPDNKPFRPIAEGPEDKVRMLAAVIPMNEQNSWFVRLLGPIEAVSAREKDFDTFLMSIRVTGVPATPLSWTVPDGWRVGPANANRTVTLLSGPASKPLEMYISKPFGGTLTENVNRWRTDFVGLTKLDDQELVPTLVPILLGGTPAHKVDLRGPGGAKAGGMGRPMGGTN